MKINLPGEGNNKGHNKSKSKKKKKVAEVKKTTSGWRDNGENLTAIICGKLVKIDVDKIIVILPNGFVIKCKTIEEAKKKAHDFYGVKYP